MKWWPTPLTLSAPCLSTCRKAVINLIVWLIPVQHCQEVDTLSWNMAFKVACKKDSDSHSRLLQTAPGSLTDEATAPSSVSDQRGTPRDFTQPNLQVSYFILLLGNSTIISGHSCLNDAVFGNERFRPLEKCYSTACDLPQSTGRKPQGHGGSTGLWVPTEPFTPLYLSRLINKVLILKHGILNKLRKWKFLSFHY